MYLSGESAGSPKHRRIIGLPVGLSSISELERNQNGIDRTRLGLPLFRVRIIPDGFSICGEGGAIFPRVLVDFFRSHAKTLPSGTATAMKPCLCSALSRSQNSRVRAFSGELSQLPGSHPGNLPRRHGGRPNGHGPKTLPVKYSLVRPGQAASGYIWRTWCRARIYTSPPTPNRACKFPSTRLSRSILAVSSVISRFIRVARMT